MFEQRTKVGNGNGLNGSQSHVEIADTELLQTDMRTLKQVAQQSVLTTEKYFRSRPAGVRVNLRTCIEKVQPRFFDVSYIVGNINRLKARLEGSLLGFFFFLLR